jgi:hypothetical protein
MRKLRLLVYAMLFLKGVLLKPRTQKTFSLYSLSL